MADQPRRPRTLNDARTEAEAAFKRTTTTAARAATGRLLFIVTGTRGRRGGHDFSQQGLVLQLVEVAALGIAAGGLPAREHRAGGLVEDAGHLRVEAKPVEAALHVASLALLEPDLVFRGLVRLLGKGRRIDAGGEVAGRRARAALERRDPRQRQRLELAV